MHGRSAPGAESFHDPSPLPVRVRIDIHRLRRRLRRSRARLRCLQKGHDWQDYLGNGVHCRRCWKTPPGGS
jgi:hypothetical protein